MEITVEKKKEIATRFIHAFNTDDWDTVREVVAPNYVFHHPIGGTVQAGPEGSRDQRRDSANGAGSDWAHEGRRCALCGHDPVL